MTDRTENVGCPLNDENAFFGSNSVFFDVGEDTTIFFQPVKKARNQGVMKAGAISLTAPNSREELTLCERIPKGHAQNL